MNKKLLGILGIVGGLGLASLLLYFFVAKEGLLKPMVPSPPESPQEAVRPAPETPKSPETPASQSQSASPAEPTPPVSGPASPPAMVPVPTPEPPPAPAEKTAAPASPAEPQKEHGLLVGKSKSYKQAQRLLAKIQKQKIPAFIRKEGKNYRVWAGPFPTPEAAAQAQKKLRASLKICPKPEKLAMPAPK